ncbi:hypothetical protein [Marinoscillum sp. MHG1-6]|uniref:hypothetical protein n=1 Tax=Marinoscillum sp. MHG1-6 TaxID=2959627 RepID=UPI0021581083|nr:hypothetical protein [Marinoscillum sp. MHG1-6]
MKKIVPILILLIGCSSPQTEQSITGNTSSLLGQWYAEGNSQNVSRWFSFEEDSTYHTWLKNQLRPVKPTGTFIITEEGLLELKFAPNAKGRLFRLDSVSENYLELALKDSETEKIVLIRTSE